MISYIKGELVEILGEQLVIETGSIGYNVRVPLSLLDNLPGIGKEVKIYTYLHVREDAMSLFGFSSRGDLEVFKMLLGVNGVGPKGALGLLSAISTDGLRLAVMTGDAKAIAKAPGVGAKTAQRIILDLKDKLKAEDLLPISTGVAELAGGLSNSEFEEAVTALISLGYSHAESKKAVSQIKDSEGMSIEDILKQSLKNLAFL